MSSRVWRLSVNGKLLVAALLAGALLAGTLAVVSAAHEPGGPGSTTGRFPAAPGNDSSTLWAVGDGADGSENSRRLARMIADAEPELFAYLGDVYQEGRAFEFANNYETVYGPLNPVTLPTPGNHDWPLHAEGYDPYWANVIGGEPPHHYATSIAGWQVLSLNSEESLDPSSPQVRWLARKVARGGSCRIAFWHRPRYSAGAHGDQLDVEPLWRLLEGRAALVLNGHDHNSQELQPQGGTVELVAGAGGHGHYPLDERYPRLAWSNATDDVALRVRLSRRHARYDFVSSAGAVLRSGSASCKPHRGRGRHHGHREHHR
jgi:Calcineurin-like phosphoesterase